MHGQREGGISLCRHPNSNSVGGTFVPLRQIETLSHTSSWKRGGQSPTFREIRCSDSCGGMSGGTNFSSLSLSPVSHQSIRVQWRVEEEEVQDWQRKWSIFLFNRLKERLIYIYINVIFYCSIFNEY